MGEGTHTQAKEKEGELVAGSEATWLGRATERVSVVQRPYDSKKRANLPSRTTRRRGKIC
jgi:hypothetical protein